MGSVSSPAVNAIRQAPVIAVGKRAGAIAGTMGRFALLREWEKARRGLSAYRLLASEAKSALFAAATGRTEAPRSCPLCGWSGPRFAPMYYVDSYRPDASCYGCTANERCRFIKAYMDRELGGMFAESRRRVLDIGPVRYSRAFFPENVDYVSFDLYSPIAMVRGDLSQTPFADQSFEVWLCSHVLDLVPDDAAAMRELFRVLRPGGVGILDNAMHWDRPTEDYGGPRARECGHRRRYGTDLPDRLRAVGFEVEVVRSTELLNPSEIERMGTGDRRLLVCRRP
jgi:SAM-dependent methyltransferase